MNRKHFIQSLVGASAFFSLPFSVKAKRGYSVPTTDTISNYKATGNAIGLKDNPIPTVRVGIIGMGNRGWVLLKMFEWLIENKHAEIVGISDLRIEKVDKALAYLKDKQENTPKAYTKNKESWKEMADRDDIDLLLIATPWEWHTPMAIYGMQKGKHVAVEVPVAYTMEDCWNIVHTAETTGKHCIMLENCCYNDEELFVLNMVQNGVFGDLTHAECAYIHDLRKHLLDEKYYEDQWRIKHHTKRNGNFYTTHGIGPVGFYMNIGRGDTFDHLTSMSSLEQNLSQTAKKHNSPHTSFKCGDMNTTMIKTKNGKSILLQFDVHTGRPYSRLNRLIGTKATHEGYPSRLYIDPEELKYWGHQWLPQEEYNAYKEKYSHPVINKLKAKSQQFKEGHGGMDFVMIYRLIRCLNLGLPLDINVYDGVMWSAITPLTEMSVAKNSQSISFPDFTGGTWEIERRLEIMRADI